MDFDDRITPKLIRQISELIRLRLNDDLDIKLGNMDLAPLSRCLIEDVGALFFNLGLQTALQIINKRALDIEDDIHCQEIANHFLIDKRC